METRWSLRQKLIETFMLMCSLDPVIISLMLSSVLPTELAQVTIKILNIFIDAHRWIQVRVSLLNIFGEGMKFKYCLQICPKKF